MTDEIELKLRLPEMIAGKRASFTPAKIAAAFGIQADAKPKRQHLVSTYFDTDDEWLRQHGMALRIRQAGKLRIQTLKAPAGEVAGAQSYLELEASITADQPDLTLIDDPDLLQRLAAAGVAERLRPTFTTDFQRNAWLIDFDSSSIELAFDRGRIICGGQEAPINELELELKSGRPAALFALADTVLDRIPFQLGHETKAARGYQLKTGQQTKPVKASAVELPGDCDVGETFTRILAQYLSLLRQNELAVVRNEDPEGIHQFRVTLRRLRSVVRAYRDLMDEVVYRHLAAELRWLQSQLGPARDLDVFISETLEPIRRRFQNLPVLVRLIDVAGARCRTARHQAHLTLEQPRYTRLQLSIYRWLATQSWRRQSATASLAGSATDFANRLMKKQHKKLRRLGDQKEIPEAELHELRVAGKKMRYLGEAFRSLYKEKPFRKYHQRLAGLQDCLGALNDAFVGDRLMVDLIVQLSEIDGVSATDIAYLRGLVTGWQANRINVGLDRFDAQWNAFRKADTFWKQG